jgi:hypothetical protein
MNDKDRGYQQPQVVESFDELEILGDTPAMSTGIITGSGTPTNSI